MAEDLQPPARPATRSAGRTVCGRRRLPPSSRAEYRRRPPRRTRGRCECPPVVEPDLACAQHRRRVGRPDSGATPRDGGVRVEQPGVEEIADCDSTAIDLVPGRGGPPSSVAHGQVDLVVGADIYEAALVLILVDDYPQHRDGQVVLRQVAQLGITPTIEVTRDQHQLRRPLNQPG